MDTNIVNIKRVSLWWRFYVLSDTWTTFKAEFMKKLSKTQVELKFNFLLIYKVKFDWVYRKMINDIWVS